MPIPSRHLTSFKKQKSPTPRPLEDDDEAQSNDYQASGFKKKARQATRTPDATTRREERKALPAPKPKNDVLFQTAVVQTRSPAITPPSDLNEEERALATVFGSASTTIMEMLNYGDTDGASSLIQKSLLQSLVSLLPEAEGNIKSSKGARGVHGYNLLVSQMRELLADLQALRDRGALGQSIVERHLRPSFLDLGVQIQLAFTRIDAEATSRMNDKDDIKEFRKEVSKVRDTVSVFMTAQYGEISQSIAKALT